MATRRARGPPRPTPTPPPSSARIEAAWQTRDLPGWLALWDFAAPDQKASEEEIRPRPPSRPTRRCFTFLRRPSPAEGATRFDADVQVFEATEPRAQVSYWRLSAEKRAGRWAIVSRQEAGQVDGLVHLSLGAVGLARAGGVAAARGLRAAHGGRHALLDPRELGPTAFAFVGRARVRFSPAPPAEREQLRQFSGETAIDREVGWAFVRLHPADFQRALETGKLEPEADPGARRAEAERVWQRPLRSAASSSTRRCPAPPGG